MIIFHLPINLDLFSPRALLVDAYIFAVTLAIRFWRAATKSTRMHIVRGLPVVRVGLRMRYFVVADFLSLSLSSSRLLSLSLSRSLHLTASTTPALDAKKHIRVFLSSCATRPSPPRTSPSRASDWYTDKSLADMINQLYRARSILRENTRRRKIRSSERGRKIRCVVFFSSLLLLSDHFLSFSRLSLSRSLSSSCC